MAQGFQADSCSMTAQTSAGSSDCAAAALRARSASCGDTFISEMRSTQNEKRNSKNGIEQFPFVRIRTGVSGERVHGYPNRQFNEQWYNPNVCCPTKYSQFR